MTALVVFASCCSAGVLFTDVTEGDLNLQVGSSRGVSWADIDGDGRLDLFVTSWAEPDRIFWNAGAGVFLDKTAGLDPNFAADLDGDGVAGSEDLALLLGHWGSKDSPADLDGDGIVGAPDLALLLGAWGPIPTPVIAQVGNGYGGRAVWADYDNDGDLDVYVAQSTGSVLFRNDGLMSFTNVTNGLPLSTGGRISRGAAWGDFDADGYVDLYVSSNSGPDDRNFLFRNLSGVGFLDVTVHPLGDPGVGRGVAWADFDNDGDQDLYLCNGLPGPDTPGNTINRLFRNEGGVFVDIASSPPLFDDGHSRGVAWGDYDNDGLLDLYICGLNVSGAGGENHLLRNLGMGQFVETTHGILGDTLQTRDCGFVDIDNDGDLDLFIVNAFADHKLFRNDGGVFTTVETRPLINSDWDANSAAWGDYDRDGDMDVYIAVAGRLSRLFRNNLDGANNWLVVELTGTASNRSAIGARVTVTAGELTQIREVQSGSGYLTQHMLGAHFGLGQAELVDSVEIRWPSGLVQNLTDVSINQYLDLVEPE